MSPSAKGGNPYPTAGAAVLVDVSGPTTFYADFVVSGPDGSYALAGLPTGRANISAEFEDVATMTWIFGYASVDIPTSGGAHLADVQLRASSEGTCFGPSDYNGDTGAPQ